MFPNVNGSDHRSYTSFTGETGQGPVGSANPGYTYDFDVDVEDDEDEESDQVFVVISAPHNRRVTVVVDPSEDTEWVVD